MKRRVMCLWLSVLMLFSALPVFAADEIVVAKKVAGIESEYNPVIFEADFESGNFEDYGFLYLGENKGGSYSIKQRDEDKGLSLKMSHPTDASYLVKKLDKPYKDKSMVLSFSYLRESADNLLFLRTASSNKAKDLTNMNDVAWRQTFFSEKGRASLFTAFRGWGRPSDDEAYVKERIGEWNDMDIFIDYPHTEMSFFLNGQYVKTIELNAEFVDLSAFAIIMYKGGDLWVDDISLRYLDRADLLGYTEDTMPKMLFDYSIRPIDIDINSNRIGNIFPNNELPIFDIDYTERYGIADKVDVTYTVRNEFGKEVWSGNDEFDIDAYGKVQKRISIPTERYDLYYLYVDIAAENHRPWSQFTQFSYVNNPPVGYRNRNTGMVLHIGQGREWEKQVELLDLAGVGIVRDEIAWADVEIEPNVWVFPERIEGFLNALAEKDIMLFHNISYGGPSWRGAVSTETYAKGYGEYAYQLAKKFTEIGLDASLGAYNEWNHSGTLDPAWYASWQKEMYEGVKKANPNMSVAGGETSGVPISMLEKAFEAMNGERYADVWSIHIYSYAATGPETSAHTTLTNQINELLEKYGYGGTPVWIGENGWSTMTGMATERMQARYLSRIMAHQAATKKWEVIMNYEFQNTGIYEDLRESNFGMVEFYQPSWEHPEPMAAKPSYLTYAGYNAMMHDTEYVETIDFGNSIHSYRFKKGEESLLYAVAGEMPQSVGMKVGCDEVTIYDMYGNPKKVSTVDGVLTVYLDADPIYICGNFDAVVPCEPLFVNNSSSLSIASGSRGEVSVTKNIDKEVTVETVAGGAVRANGEATAKGNTTTVPLITDISENDEDVFFTDVIMDEKCVFSAKTDITYIPSISINGFNVEQNSSLLDIWSGVLSLKSHQSDETLSGKLTFTYPEKAANMLGTTSFEQVLPKSKQNVAIRMPAELLGEQVNLKVDLDTGESVSMTVRLSSTDAHYAATKPVIDGKADPGEWNLSKSVRISSKNGETALTFAFMWDEENLYFYGLTKDEKFYQQVDIPSDLWSQDSIQLALCSSDSSTGFTEIGFAKLPSGMTTYAWSYETGMDKDVGIVDTVTLGVSRVGSENTLYEAAIPWKDVVANPDDVIKNGSFKMDILLNNNDAGGREFVEYGYGIANAKDVKKTTRFNLVQ